MGALVFVLLMAAAGAVAVAVYAAKQRRREALATFALQYRLEYARVDPFGLSDLEFHLFGLGEGRGCENVVWGQWQDLPVREADYWYYTEATDSEGHRSKSYHHFSIVAADLGAAMPRVLIEKENLLTRLADALSFHDIDFESERFNREFQVKAADREFAYKLIDARMIRWLLSTDGRFGFEVGGSGLLVWSGRRRPTELVPLFGSAALFRDHIPSLVWKELGVQARPGPDEERSRS